jgi:hypothetical protein
MNVRPRGDRLRPERLLPVDDDKRILRHSLGTGATPMTITGLPEVAKRQEKVQYKLRKRIMRNLAGRSPLIQKFAEQNFLGRFARRLDRNRASYDTRLIETIPDEIRDTHDRVLVGDGSPKDALVVMSALGMRSIELARLTQPGVEMYPNPQLDEMTEDVYRAVIELGGVVHDEAELAYELSNLDTIVPPEAVTGNQKPAEHEAVRDGIMATVKRHIATMPDDTKVIQRTSYIIDLNELPPEISQAIRAVNTLKAEDPLRAVAEAAQMDMLLPYLLDRGSAERSIIPISTTLFAHNEAIARVVEDLAKPEKRDEPSESMQKFYEALEKDTAELADLWGFTDEQRRTDRYTRGIGAHAIGADERFEDD